MVTKQISMVLDAVNAGCETSDQISAYTGLSIATVSNYLTELTDDGLIRRVARNALRLKERGPYHHRYAPPTPTQAKEG